MRPTGNTLKWGARAYAAFRSIEGDVYACPICGREVPLSGARLLMSREHAPPGKLAGTSISWTCRASCNNRWGSLESKLIDYDRALDFRLGMMHPGERITVDMEIGGYGVVVKILRIGSDFQLFPDAEANPPELIEDVTSFLASSVEAGGPGAMPFQLRMKDVNKSWETRIAALRAAFVVAHAALGYSYSQSDGLRIVRRQLQYPEQRILGAIAQDRVVATHPPSSRERRSLFQSIEHDDLQCVVVVFGRYSVILPLGDSPDDFYEAFDSKRLLKLGEDGPFDAITFEWPSPPRYLLDLNPAGAMFDLQMGLWALNAARMRL